MKRFLPLLLTATATALPSPVAYQIVHHADIAWTVPGNLPPGAEYHLIYEDPNTHAVQALVRFPEGYALPPHTHTHDETLFIVKGKLVVGIGGKTETLKPGDYVLVPAGEPHSLQSPGWGGCEMLMAISGPYDVKLTAKDAR